MRILVANRGEISARVARTAAELGHTSIAVYAEQDAETPATRIADEAYSLGGATLAETYMNTEVLLEVAKRANADMIHPGYGFLSENADFAQAVTDAGITWIGPSAETISMLGDKIAARRTAEAAGVPMIPGTTESLGSVDELRGFAEAHGYPVAAKRADGGGGRGIVVMRSDSDINDFEVRFGHELAPFFLEKFIEKARHVETQCMRDSHGNFAVVSTRDCSVQRRNQKVIEEAPAANLPDHIIEALESASASLFEAASYVGLGTCEFLVDDAGIYFLEVNPRLQVEHTVSEEVTGLDLVEEQIRIASGGSISDVPELRGHSIELRITSEDPGADLMPTTGTVSKLAWPLGHGIRIETSIHEGDTVAGEFDSMIAKVIVTGPTRERAIARCRRAIKELSISGVATSTPILDQILAHEDYANFDIYTKWMEEIFLPGADLPEPFTPEPTAGNGTGLEAPRNRTFTAEIDGRRHTITVPADLFSSPAAGANVVVGRSQQPRRGTQRTKEGPASTQVSADGVIPSPIQAIVVRVVAEPGQQVDEGDLLLVLEAMKMEKYIHAESAGTVAEVFVNAGDNVVAGSPLVKVES